MDSCLCIIPPDTVLYDHLSSHLQIIASVIDFRGLYEFTALLGVFFSIPTSLLFQSTCLYLIIV